MIEDEFADELAWFDPARPVRYILGWRNQSGVIYKWHGEPKTGAYTDPNGFPDTLARITRIWDHVTPLGANCELPNLSLWHPATVGMTLPKGARYISQFPNENYKEGVLGEFTESIIGWDDKQAGDDPPRYLERAPKDPPAVYEWAKGWRGKTDARVIATKNNVLWTPANGENNLVTEWVHYGGHAGRISTPRSTEFLAVHEPHLVISSDGNLLRPR